MARKRDRWIPVAQIGGRGYFAHSAGQVRSEITGRRRERRRDSAGGGDKVKCPGLSSFGAAIAGLDVAMALSPLMFIALLACSSQRLDSDMRTDPQLITENEVVASHATTAYELIRSLRPNFLTYRGETSFARRTSRPHPTVYVDDQAFGQVSILNSIPRSDVSSVRLYRASEAMTKFGTGNAGGVIAITTRH